MKTTTFLMFQNNDAEEAVNFYVSLFPQSKISVIERYKQGEIGTEGTVKIAEFSLAGQLYKAIDSPIKHNFEFTPSTSIYVSSTDEEEIDRLWGKLKQNGTELMPLDGYEFSKKYGWVNDRFGVSWQLNLED